MTAYVGCCGLLGIAVFIAFLFLRRKKIENEMTEFYKENSLYTSENCPPNVRESLDAASDNLYCCRANLTTAKGEKIEFCWWEWYLKSSLIINGAPSVSFDQYLAVSFEPEAVGDEFIRKAIDWADKSGDEFAKKAKDFFVTDTDTPYRAETLADGSLIICWHTVTKRRDAYQAKITWLKNSVSVPSASAVITPIDVYDAAPNESETVGTVFYTYDSYATLRHKFNRAWTNLKLELHQDWTAVFQHEGRDEFDIDATFGDPTRAGEIAFVLTDETTVKKARQLFSETYGGTADILRGIWTPKDDESLASGNNTSSSED